MRGKQTGVVRVTMNYTKGYDRKMSSSAHVLVLIKDVNSVRYSQLKQIMGRSSRDQGIPVGLILIAKTAG